MIKRENLEEFLINSLIWLKLWIQKKILMMKKSDRRKLMKMMIKMMRIKNNKRNKKNSHNNNRKYNKITNSLFNKKMKKAKISDEQI
jgi:hypothetical protein